MGGKEGEREQPERDTDSQRERQREPERDRESRRGGEKELGQAQRVKKRTGRDDDSDE